jgi:hypothetical protein
MKFLSFLWLLGVVILVGQNSVFAQEFSSTDFKSLDPVIVPAEYSTSAGFKLWSTISEMSIGTSTSLSFGVNSGSLYFPFVSSPALSATAGSGQVSLSWTASDGYLGWTPSSYQVGQATVSGGPYTYSSMGNVLSNTVTGLTGGTTYYFVVVVEDAFGNDVATSSEVSATPTAASTSGGGGGGSSGSSSGSGGVNFSGRAYPLSKVTILKDGQIVLSTIAGPDSNFNVTVGNLNTGNYNFSVYGEDSKGVRSSPFSFPIYITGGVTTNITGIFIAPTISVDKAQVKKGDNIAIFGQSVSGGEVVININSENELFIKRPTDKNGVYFLNFDTSVLEIGDHQTRSKASINEETSYFSNTVAFKVGTQNMPIEVKCVPKGDLNKDCRVNLVDFSIAAFWYLKPTEGNFLTTESKELNGDGKVNLVDFSIMAYYWTG